MTIHASAIQMGAGQPDISPFLFPKLPMIFSRLDFMVSMMLIVISIALFILQFVKTKMATSLITLN